MNLIRGFRKGSYNYVLKYILGYCTHYISLIKIEYIDPVELDKIFIRGRTYLGYQGILEIKSK